jgi:hypothetical protein
VPLIVMAKADVDAASPARTETRQSGLTGLIFFRSYFKEKVWVSKRPKAAQVRRNRPSRELVSVAMAVSAFRLTAVTRLT